MNIPLTAAIVTGVQLLGVLNAAHAVMNVRWRSLSVENRPKAQPPGAYRCACFHGRRCRCTGC